MLGRVAAGGSEMRLQGRKFLGKNVQAVSSKMTTRSKQVSDRQEGPQKLSVEILRKTELSCVKFDSLKLMRFVWQVTCLSLKQSVILKYRRMRKAFTF